MLYNLNGRSSTAANTAGMSSSGNGARRFRFSPGTKKGRQPGIMVDGIQVNHVATVHVDEPIHLDSFRQSRSRPAPRPAARAAPAPVPAKAAPAGVPATMPQQQQPSMLGGIMQTAAGVAVGSTIGHGMSSMLFGGGSSAAAAEAPAAAAPAQSYGSGATCEIQAKDFTSCLNATANDMSSCSFYLDQLKACQQAAAPY
ncbi:hypothetical protein RQP46_001223 [Phenoliferia psychrophenolica]